MSKILVSLSIFFSTFSAFAGGIVCTTKNILGFPDQFAVLYQPGPGLQFEKITFAKCEPVRPGDACKDYKLAKTFDLDPVVSTRNWPIGIYKANSADGSSVAITVTKKDGVHAEYEGYVYLALTGSNETLKYDLSCNTAE